MYICIYVYIHTDVNAGCLLCDAYIRMYRCISTQLSAQSTHVSRTRACTTHPSLTHSHTYREKGIHLKNTSLAHARARRLSLSHTRTRIERKKRLSRYEKYLSPTRARTTPFSLAHTRPYTHTHTRTDTCQTYNYTQINTRMLLLEETSALQRIAIHCNAL